ncbi:uncharacterized protein LOC118646884 [Monomorium pharaonis]|uniref:uncharacterized protein LOC118646884 n=1 Tax=Monomorium pharaonis TaxID=307658 RepID=UPI0017478B26|nr:uncharacterized protein LOC118646884 [Monomorium pharaonis]
MAKWCVVPNCKTSSKTVPKRSTFQVPKDIVTWKKWEKAIPGITKLYPLDIVCEKHFKEEDISREWVKHDANGKVIARVAYKKAQLKQFAVPTRFGDVPTEKKNCEPQLEYAMQVSNSPSIQEINTFVTQTVDTDIELSLSPMQVLSCELIVADSFVPQKPAKVSSSLEITELIPENASANNDFSAVIPERWSWVNMPNYAEISQYTLFTYSIMNFENGVYCPVTQKSVTLDADGKLKYFIYGRHIDTQDKDLERVIKKKEMLKNILRKFQDMNICSGQSDISIYLIPADGVYQDYVNKWRSKGCSLLSKQKTCKSCIKLRKCILQRKARLKSRTMINRINNASNSVDQGKLLAMRKKIRREKRQKYRAKNHVEHLITCMKAQEAQMTSMQDTAVDKKLGELENISMSQKLVVKEIFAAASKKDARGRRYTDDWIMCLLLNIRSPKDYGFLRKNNILPLPCTKTIRNYFSLINIKCGFDEEFSKLIEKHFALKTPLQRHGILLLDEINLRKSVTVCSRNLTYVGLTDLGDGGQQSTDINEQATHGLVLMFQPLADVYTQPIAVFASKNSVKGEELAKIVIKAICYLEQCGAMIHGVVADGAATNTKMCSLLGVRGTIEDTKTWFTHPLDDKRKVFVFSDVCHLVKNVRNRLYNKRKLRLKSTNGYVSWNYFETLYNIDKDHPGNARACPKITLRHVVLDNTSKMRVRLATQIFSNSVADGLAFYLSHGCEGLSGCEETISFCKRMNDMFDAMNRKSPNQGLTPHCKDFKILEDTLRWLDEWELAVSKTDITAEEFLTVETSKGLRISLRSTMDLCKYLIDKFNFKYLLTGKVNQDNLEKFFGTIRQCAGCNDHPNCPTFLQLYKLLSVYSVIKPPKYGNCTVSSDSRPTLISIDEIKAIYGNKREGKSAESMRTIKTKLDQVLQSGDWEADDILDPHSEHDYALSPILDCIIYYVTGFVF